MSTASKSMTAMWADPVKRAAFIESRNNSAGYSNPERGLKIAAKARERWACPEYKERVSASLREASKGRIGSPHSTPVLIDGVQYPSIAEAVRKTGLARSVVSKTSKEQTQ